MNPILADIYSAVIPSAPFIIAAYVILWVVLIAYVIGVAHRVKRAETQVAVLEKQVGLRSEVAREKGDDSNFEATDSF